VGVPGGWGEYALATRRNLHAAFASMIQGDRANGSWLEFHTYFSKSMSADYVFPGFFGYRALSLFAQVPDATQ
jgi:hypothetical protein